MTNPQPVTTLTKKQLHDIRSALSSIHMAAAALPTMEPKLVAEMVIRNADIVQKILDEAGDDNAKRGH